MTDLHPVAAAVTAVLGLASGPLVPALVRRVPPVEVDPVEVDPVEVDGEVDGQVDGEVPAPEHVDVAAVAERPNLAWRAGVAGAVAAGLVGLVVGGRWPLLYLVPLVPVSVALAAIDWRTRILPSRLIYPAYLLVLVGVLAGWLLAGRPEGASALVRAGLGAVLSFGFFYVVWFVYPRGMGFGDVRLAGLLGLALGYLGWSQLVVGMYAGFLLGGVVGGGLALARVVDRKGYPFGPFMLVGALVGVALGQPVIDALTG